MFSKKKKNKNELLLDLTADNFSAKKAREISILSSGQLFDLYEKARNMIKKEALQGATSCKVCECGNRVSQGFPITFTEEKLEWASYYLKYFLDNGFAVREIIYKYSVDEESGIARHNVISTILWTSKDDFTKLKEYIETMKDSIIMATREVQVKYRIDFIVSW